MLACHISPSSSSKAAAAFGVTTRGQAAAAAAAAPSMRPSQGVVLELLLPDQRSRQARSFQPEAPTRGQPQHFRTRFALLFFAFWLLCHTCSLHHGDLISILNINTGIYVLDLGLLA